VPEAFHDHARLPASADLREATTRNASTTLGRNPSYTLTLSKQQLVIIRGQGDIKTARLFPQGLVFAMKQQRNHSLDQERLTADI